MPGALTVPIVQRHLSDVLIVSDDQIREAIRFAFLRLKLVIEPSGAAVLAAVLAGYLPPSIGPIGLIISGGNIDPELLAGLWGA
jgi:threonine dehydratase